MPKVRVQIAATLEATWKEFIKKENWSDWWIDDLVAVTPSWSRSGSMVWGSRYASTITSLIERQELTITDPFLIQHFRFFDSGNGRTNVEIEFAANGLTVFDDNGLKQAKLIRDALQNFKTMVEAADTQQLPVRPLVMSATQKHWWQVW